MSNIVFILGAGASALAGAPLMKNFIETARKVSRYERVLARGEDDRFKRVFDAIRSLQIIQTKINVLDPFNIESVFSLLDMANFLDRPFLDTGETNLENDLIFLIQKTLEYSIKYTDVGYGAWAAPYEDFAILLQKLVSEGHHITVITFNYDIALEHSLHAKRVSFDYHLKEILNPYSKTNVHLLKLHGSLNWSVSHNPLGKFEVETSLDFNFFKTSDINKYMHAEIKLPNVSLPLIVPPSWHKGAYQQLMKPVWVEASKALENVENLYIVGYSFPRTDFYFDMLLGIGLSKSNPLNSFTVFDINKEVEGTYKKALAQSLLARFSFEKATFKEAISMVASKFSVSLIKTPARINNAPRGQVFTRG